MVHAIIDLSAGCSANTEKGDINSEYGIREGFVLKMVFVLGLQEWVRFRQVGGVLGGREGESNLNKGTEARKSILSSRNR